MNTSRRARAEHDHGAVMVELALVLPLLIILLVGIFDFGLVYNAQISIQAASREGARALALGEPTSAVTAAVNNAAGGATITSITQSGCPATPTPTSYATVTVTGTYTFTIPFLNLGTRTYDASASMRCGL
jgi:Flp pilus assembly protein TadG